MTSEEDDSIIFNLIRLNRYFLDYDWEKINSHYKNILIPFTELKPNDQSKTFWAWYRSLPYGSSSSGLGLLLGRIVNASKNKRINDVEGYINNASYKFQYIPVIHAFYTHNPEKKLKIKPELEDDYREFKNEEERFQNPRGMTNFEHYLAIFLSIITGIILIIFAVWFIGLIISIPYVLIKGKDSKYMWYSWMALMLPD